MKARLALIALLILAVPTSAAQTVPSKETVTVIQAGQGLTLIDVVEWGAPSSPFQFWAPQGAAALKVALVRADNSETALTATKTGATREGHDEYRTTPAAANATGSYKIRIEYVVGGTGVTLRPWYDPAQFTVFAEPLEGNQPDSPTLGFMPVSEGRYHSTLADVAANQSHAVAFVATPHTGATNQDQTKWVWAFGGLLVGFLVAYVAFSKGWIAAKAKATKFQKGGAMESSGMLEARRRTLLAALKDLEAAHESKAVSDDVYGPLKEEYKAQAVRVMRTLEEKKEPPA